MKHNNNNIKKLIAALEVFQEIDPAMSLPSMLAFLHYHDLDGRSGNRSIVEERLGMTGATASRATLYRHEYKAPKIKGHNKLERYEDPEDRRYQVVRYNRDGLDLLGKISEALD